MLVLIWGILIMGRAGLAAESGGLGVRPDGGRSWFILTLKPGEVKSEKAVFINSSKTVKDGLVYAVDAEATSEGGFAPMPKDAPRKDIGSWISLPITSISLPPGRQETVDFTITVPPEAEPGDYAGAVIVEGAPSLSTIKTPAGGSVGANIVTRVGARVYVTIPGERIEKFKMSEVSAEWQEDNVLIKFNLENTGNVRLNPGLTIIIREQASKKEITKIDYPPNTFELWPGKKISPPTRWDNARGHGQAEIIVTAKQGGQTEERLVAIDTGEPVALTKQITKEYGNMGLIVMLIIIAVLLFLVLVFLATVWRKMSKLTKGPRRTSRRRSDGPPPPTLS